MKLKNKKGFTLVEMLVVIAIIGILMALLFPAFTHVMKKAKVTKAKTEISQIEQAWKAFLMDYKKFPPGTDAKEGVGMETKYIDHLIGDDTSINVRGTMYMELDPNENYTDPWGRIYNIKMNNEEVYKQVMVWSNGPKINDPKDNIKNWKTLSK